MTCLTLVTRPAHATYSSMVVDAGTGEVLNEVNADSLVGPASLTKMMTLYLTFQELHKGTIRLGQMMQVSTFAANREPSRINIEAGDQVVVRDLILALVTKSANNAATVLAEGIAGSEAEFARRMTDKAHQLGMTNTVFRNANGLPDAEQVTTARDMVKLGQALISTFPDEYRYFSTREFTFRGEVIRTHDNLLTSYEGTDGIKTGYTMSSGFNLVTSAVRDNRRLIGVVLGSRTAYARDRLMVTLLTDAFANRPTDALLVAQAGGERVPARLLSRAARVVAALSPIGRAEAATLTAPLSRRNSRVAAAVPASAASAERAEPAGASKWSIQVGAYSHEKQAAHAGREVARLPSLRGKSLVVMTPSKGEAAKVYRVRLNGFNEQQAQSACQAVKQKGHPCAVISPAGGALKLASR